jgi:hypothetical protein
VWQCGYCFKDRISFEFELDMFIPLIFHVHGQFILINLPDKYSCRITDVKLNGTSPCIFVELEGNCVSVLSNTTDYDARFEILTVVAMNITIFWDVMPYSLVEMYCFQAKFLQNVGHGVTSQKTVFFESNYCFVIF